jgi:hypothetical protein
MKHISIIIISSIFILTNCKKEGCTDPAALNYELSKNTTSDNSTCIYLGESAVQPKLIVQGDITTPTTWSKVTTSGPDYILTGDVRIFSELTIEAGVQVEIGNGVQITVGWSSSSNAGHLNINGTANNQVTFYTKDGDFWNGFLIFDDYGNEMNINYGDFSGVSGSRDFLYIAGSSTIGCHSHILNSTVRNENSPCAIDFQYSWSSSSYDLNVAGTNFIGYNTNICY